MSESNGPKDPNEPPGDGATRSYDDQDEFNRQLLLREMRECPERGLEVVQTNSKTWRCRLTYFPDVYQDCSFKCWTKGPDGRVRPAPGRTLSSYWYTSEKTGRVIPRVKIEGRAQVNGSAAKSGAEQLIFDPPEPSASEGSMSTRLSVLEQKIDRLVLAVLGA